MLNLLRKVGQSLRWGTEAERVGEAGVPLKLNALSAGLATIRGYAQSRNSLIGVLIKTNHDILTLEKLKKEIH